MKKENNKKNIVIGILIGIIVILTSLLILFITGTINFNNDTNSNESNTTINNEKEYKVYDEVTLSDGSKWMVIENSSKDSDYVTLIKKESNDISNQSTYDLLWNELTDFKTKYDTSNLKKYVDNLAQNIPTKLKEVNGYKIRLITVEELMNLDNNWKYDETNDNYTYIGNDLNKLIFAGLTMTETKCTEGKCTAFYIESAGYDPQTYYLTHWASGLPQIKPVINVYKTELEK